MSTDRLWRWLERVSTIAVLVVAAIVVWTYFSKSSSQRGPKVPGKPISTSAAESVGSATAPVAMLAFSDFQCPYCGRFARDIWPELKKARVDTGQLRVMFRHLPLGIHANAFRAAAIASCAGDQGRFWPTHDLLFSAQDQLASESLWNIVASAGVDVQRMRDCVGDSRTAARINADVAAATALGISGTPTFLIGRAMPNDLVKVNTVLTGARPVDEFTAAIDKAIALK